MCGRNRHQKARMEPHGHSPAREVILSETGKDQWWWLIIFFFPPEDHQQKTRALFSDQRVSTRGGDSISDQYVTLFGERLSSSTFCVFTWMQSGSALLLASPTATSFFTGGTAVSRTRPPHYRSTRRRVSSGSSVFKRAHVVRNLSVAKRTTVCFDTCVW